MTDRLVDLHMHTTVSDGTDSPEQILEKVRELGLYAFSVSDHDAVKAANVIRPLLRDGDPLFVPGVEFSCRDEEGKYHILGYGFDPDGAEINKVVDLGHSLRMKKVRRRLELIESEFGFTFPPEEIEKLLALDNPGKPHIGLLMVKYGYAESKEQAISEYLNKVRVKSGYVRPEEAISGILGSGGVPVLAHPFYGSGDEIIIGPDMERRIQKLTGFGLRGIEAFYSGFTEKFRNAALDIADRYDLLVTAGSDYHGKNKLVRLGDTGLDAVPEYPERLRRFIGLFAK